MPGDAGRKHAAQQRSVLLRSDQDSGMALIKSKDGRTKWLTVNADPSSTSFTWDERVRSWASKLGVCAQPAVPPAKQATPLPTPPPDDLEEPQQRWPAGDATDGVSTATASGAEAVSGTIRSDAVCTPTGGASLSIGSATNATASGVISAPEATATITPSPDAPPACSTTPVSGSKKPAGNAKRVGSFARGFLLGLGGGGGGGGAGAAAAATPSRNADCAQPPPPSAVQMETKGDVLTPASTLTDTSSLEVKQGDCGGEEGEGMVAGAGAGVPSVCGRDRWVKGAPDSPNSSDGDDSDEGFAAKEKKRGMEIGSNGGGGTGGDGGGGGSGGKANVVGSACGNMVGEGGCSACVGSISPISCAGDDARADVGGGDGDDGMAWLDTGAGSNGGGSGAKAASKKKKKSKAKGKGGKTKKTCPSGSKGGTALSSHDLLSATGGGGGGVAPAAVTSAAAAAAGTAAAACTAAAATTNADTSTSSSLSSKATSKRARTRKQRKALNVTFGCVRLLEFTRDVGGCGVPTDGTWGLALGLPFRETLVEVDGYEASKAEILEARTAELSKRQRHLSTGETRQFDHRPVGERNPLFSRLDEKERSKKLLDYACFHKGDLKELDRDNSLNGGASSDDHSNSLSRSDSQSQGDTSMFCAFSHKVSHAEFVDKSHAASPELTALRHSRRDSQGCSCACVRADKLNLAKLRGELNKRGLKASGCKKDLTKVLQEAMRQEDEEDGGRGHKVCRSEECQCVKDGVECHADLCNCCKGPSIGHKDVHHGGNCGNPEGVYAYSSSVVRSHRHPYVTKKTVPGRERGHSRSDSMGSEHR